MQEESLLRLEGVVENIVYRNSDNGYTVLEIADSDDYITAVGIMPLANVGDKVALTGVFTEHKNYGRQFSAKACEVCRPTEAADILRYLSSGAVKGIGASTAQKLVKEFGESTLDVMENHPERVALLRGISSEKALDFAAQLKANAGIRTLMLYLGEYGISNTAAVKVYNALGAGCTEQIKANPYILCQGGFGIPFERADFIAKRENLENNSGVRVRAGLSYILRHNEGNGHTCLPKDKLKETAAGFLGIDIARAEECLEEMIFDRSLIQDELDGREFIFTPQLHLNEMYIASRIKMLLSFPAEREERLEQAIEELERGNGIEYAELQRKAITGALSEGVLVLTGGPGTGKCSERR